MKIKEGMTKKPHIIQENNTIIEAAQKMKAWGCGIFPVENSQYISGVITDRDIIIRAVASEKNLKKTLVKNIMTKEIDFCDKDELLKNVIWKMNHYNRRRVLIKDKDHPLLGILSLTDIIKRVDNKHLLTNLLKEYNTN